MKSRIAIIAAVVALSARAVAAQEFQPYSESLNDSARQVRERVLRDSTVNRHRGGAQRRAVSPRTRQTCAHRRQAAAAYGRDHPQVRRLYALCARAGL
ncbi:hypothetical protein ASG29_02395 [Sphingomonas sp. Leaf412]|uniref:hypothetical protein n=1 Tax=Sphingomonas sp. Leaf412 TaxID=1736370 RepID=UPI0006FB9814|nr:hypothetical protein [Sphingomonas sp. Leaf412]KQT35004.1 hypothetical protein ASG29_02395 [Sphingomonas sp. Leaf412]